MPKVGERAVGVPNLSPLPRAYWRDPTLGTYGGKGLGTMLWCGDSVQIMPTLPPGEVDLAFADPPFNQGLDYDVYEDDKTYLEYLDWTHSWMEGVHRLLSPTGSFWVAICIKWQAQVKLMAERVGFHWRDTVVWHYTFGPRQEGKFTPSWVALHYFTKHNRAWTWNPEGVRVPSARQLKYKDRRAVPGGKLPDNVWALLPAEEDRLFQPGGNAWLESRVCGTFSERSYGKGGQPVEEGASQDARDRGGEGHPCQMPVSVLDRIIAVSSNRGDLVFDPFLGSGTTAVASVNANRSFWGVELSKGYLDHHCIPRLREVHGRLEGYDAEIPF